MTVPADDSDKEAKRLLANVLAARVSDRLVDVSRHINATFFCGGGDGANGGAPKIGRIFLSGAAAARRGNVTETMLFCGGKDDGERRRGEETVAEENRWIRGVLVLSGAVLPPPEATFMNCHANGRVLLFGGDMPSLFVRVVRVSLPSFLPHGDGGEKSAANMTENARENHRRLLRDSERCFLQGLGMCLAWLWRGWRSARRQRLKKQEGEKEKHGDGADGERGDECLSSPFFLSSSVYTSTTTVAPSSVLSSLPCFTEEPACLSVPLYYFSVHMEDNARSRLADFVDISADFMDLMVDAEMSVVKETTALLQGIVKLSEMIRRYLNTGDGGDDCNSPGGCQRAIDEWLLALHQQAQLHLLAACRFDSHARNDCRETPPPCDDQAAHVTNAPASFVGDMPPALPGVLAHCVRGVSRSPSVVMAYYMRKCRGAFCALSRADVCAFSFPRLLQCLQEARPVVNPQICFVAELRSMWLRLAQDVAAGDTTAFA